MLLVKLGGSVITEKSNLKVFDSVSTEALAKELASYKGEIIVVHGAGSFGHPEAKRYNLNKGYHDDSQLVGVAEVQRDVRYLNRMVLDALLFAGIKPVSIPPGSVCRCRAHAIEELGIGLFKDYLDLGMAPVTFGDVVLDNETKFCICSGDQLMMELAHAFNPEKIILRRRVALRGAFTLAI